MNMLEKIFQNKGKSISVQTRSRNIEIQGKLSPGSNPSHQRSKEIAEQLACPVIKGQ